MYAFPPVPESLIESGFRRFADIWNPILDEFERCGVRFCSEAHPTSIAFDIVTAHRMLDAIGRHNAMGFNFDPSHFHWQGVDPVQFLREFSDRVFHTHMKDAVVRLTGRSSILSSHLNFGHADRGWDFRSLGHGGVRFGEIIRTLNHIGYQGPLSVEWEDSGMDREHGAHESLGFLRKLDFAPPRRASRAGELTGGRGADLAYECSGTAGSLAACWNAVKKEGTLVPLGIYPGPIETDFNKVTMKELRVIKSVIAESGWSGVNGEIVDLDGDGDHDIAMGGIVWFRNPRIGGGSWVKHQIDDQQVHDIEIGDIDLDGRLDVVARDQSAFRGSESGKGGSAIYVYRQTGPSSWEKSVIDCPHGEGLKLADIDQDGDPDIVIGARWYENTGDATAGHWPEHIFTRLWTEPDAKVEVADFNGDGKPDVVLTPSELRGETYRVAWYEHPSAGPHGEWKEHIIVTSIECVVHALGVGDIDGDRDQDVVIAEMHQGEDPDEVGVLLNEDNGNTWRKQVISNDGSHDIVVADIGDDGDLDIIGVNHAGVHPLELWRNELKQDQ